MTILRWRLQLLFSPSHSVSGRAPPSYSSDRQYLLRRRAHIDSDGVAGSKGQYCVLQNVIYDINRFTEDRVPDGSIDFGIHFENLSSGTPKWDRIVEVQPGLTVQTLQKRDPPGALT